MVRAQGIITQLIFDHALRIRVKADVDSPSGSARSTAAPTPDSASIIESPSGPSSEGASPDDSADETVAGEQGSPAPKDKKRKRSGTTVSESSVSSNTTAVEKPAEESTKGGNLAGKLNNLITTDLNNIVEGRDFLFVGGYLLLFCDAGN